MHYQVKLTTINDKLTFFIPDPEQVKNTYNVLLENDHSTPFPFWAKIWPSAKAICLFLEKEPQWIQGKNVLEIGAGIGLPSFTLAPLASSIIISDYSTEAIALIQKNIQHLQLKNATALCLDWNHYPTTIEADTILLCDINYDPIEFKPLFKLIQHFLLKGSTLIIATPYRITAVPFADTLQPYIKRIEWETITEENQLVEISIMILSR